MIETTCKKWREAVSASSSLIIAGVDPKPEEVEGRYNSDFKEFLQKYLNEVAPYVAGFKPNTAFFSGSDFHYKVLEEELLKIKEKQPHLYMILDTKAADIGSTNQVRFSRELQSGVFDSVTFSPFAGNINQAVLQAQERNVGLISMCLMSNSEYSLQKNNLMRLTDEEADDLGPFENIIKIGEEFYLPQYLVLAYRAKKAGTSGVVIGCTDHIKSIEIGKAVSLLGDKQLILSPGIGKQEGSLNFFPTYLEDRLMVSIGTGLMYPSNENRLEAVNNYNKVINEWKNKNKN